MACPLRAIFNGDVALKPSETQRVIDGFLHDGMAFLAFPQHPYDMEPDVWFMRSPAASGP